MTPAFLSWLGFSWQSRFDGGGDHTSEHDSGGETNKGVTLATWNDAVARGIVSGSLATATVIELASVLYELFWKECRCDAMHPAVGGVVFQMAMADGVGGAGRIIERKMSVPVDTGTIGPITLKAINAIDPATAVTMLTAAEEAFEDRLPKAIYFGRGWHNRAEAAKAFALSIIRTGNLPNATSFALDETPSA